MSSIEKNEKNIVKLGTAVLMLAYTQGILPQEAAIFLLGVGLPGFGEYLEEVQAAVADLQGGKNGD